MKKTIQKKYDCIVIGAGHAGIEAALASSRMGCKTLMVTLSFDAIGQMSCNPAIGGVGKGQLVKEIDVLGGEMAKAADKTAIQFRQLNASKGAAVRSSRCQSDRKRYRLYMQRSVSNQDKLDILTEKVSEISVRNKKVIGIKTVTGKSISSSCVIVAAGTFLNGKIHLGPQITPGGRIGEESSIKLAKSLKDFGFELLSFKTGTPPRLDGKTIDFSRLTRQDSDENPAPFSFSTNKISKNRKFRPCYLTQTAEQTHDIIKANFHLSPMYSGQINSTGVRYCPSIEDKLKKFSGKKSHTVFLEPEGLDTDLYYPNGISTGLPAQVQEKFVRTIKGLENVKFIQYGYSIEHAVVPPTELKPNLETKKVEGLFLAGQINGTTGYEEAGAQGLMAGINAALKIKNKEPFVLGRHESYIGVLIDDLVTKGTEEPYRMFTSRVEHRLIIREDNADKRLAKYGYKFGLLSEAYYKRIEKKYDLIDKEINHLEGVRIHPGEKINRVLSNHNSSPIKQTTTLKTLLKRPGINYRTIAEFNGKMKSLSQPVIEQIEYEVKYEGFIQQQIKMVDKFKHIEKIKIPSGFNFDKVHGLSFEIREKLKRFAPASLGQANRISGVTPAAISILMIYLQKYFLSKETKTKK